MSAARNTIRLAVSLALVSPALAEFVSFDYPVQAKQGFLNGNVPNTVTTLPVTGHETATAGTMTVYPAMATTALVSSANSFLHQPIWVTVKLTDSAALPGAGSVPNGTVTVYGTLSSIAASNGTFDWNYAWIANTQSITLGSPGQFHTYTVAAPNYATDNVGVMTGTIGIQVADYQPGVNRVPVAPASEPTSLLLAALAVPAWLIGRRHRRRAVGMCLQR